MNARGLEGIAVKVECASGNVPALLHEIRHALAHLIESGTNTTLDLKRIPLAPGEEDRIVELLGTGEVHAKLQAGGRSEFFETTFAGVWLVTHYDSENKQMARFIEITRVPDMLCSQRPDIALGIGRLRTLLTETGSATQWVISSHC